MLAVLAGQNGLEEFRGQPDFLESDCTTTEQQQKSIERSDGIQGNVRWLLGFSRTPARIRIASPNALGHRNLQGAIRNGSSDPGSEQLGDDAEQIRATSAENLL